MATGAEMGVAMKLTDLPKDAFTSVIHKLDLQSILRLSKATKKTKEDIEDEFVWIELCEPWKQVVNLKVWRAEVDSAKALYRLLHSLNKLIGLWSQRDDNPCGELVYVAWVCDFFSSLLHKVCKTSSVYFDTLI